MPDLRRQALESGKTVSRKAQSRISSRASSVANSRTNSNHGSRHGSDDEEGNVSDGTNWSVNSIDDMLAVEPDDETEAWKQDLGDRIEEIIDRKRSSTQGREATLAAYAHYLMSRYAYDDIRNKVSEILSALLKSIKAESSEKETCLALRAVALTLITAPSESAYDVIFQALKRSYASSQSLIVKAAAIHTLSTVTIYGGASSQEIEELMDEFLEIVETDGASIDAEDSGEVVKAVCEEWGFLATHIDDLQEKTEAAMDAFVGQLESSDTSVQVSAGENIALLYERSYTPREVDDEPVSDEDMDDEAHPDDTNLVKRYEVYRQTAQLIHMLTRLSRESSKRIAKKDRKTLHVSFADILNTVEHPSRGPRYQNAIDSETGRRYGSRLTVRIHKSGSMKIDRWWKLHRLQALRRVLGGGFMVHYESNGIVFDSLPIMVFEEK